MKPPEIPPSNRPRAAALAHGCLVAAAAMAVLVSNLGGPALWDEDEPKNAACTMAMLATNDWVVPTFNGRLRIEKPALVNWLQIAGCAVAGANETGVRLGSAVVTIGTCLVTWHAGRLLVGPAVGLIAGMVMAGCVWTGVGGRAATPDAPLVLATTLAFHSMARAAVRHGARPVFGMWDASFFGAACGLGTLAKGPVGIVVPLAALLVVAIWSRGRGESLLKPVHDLRIGTILAVAATVAGPWYAWVAWRTGGEWLRGFLLVHNVERFATTLEGHSGSFLYYPLVLLVGLFPWSIAAAAAAWHSLAVLRDASRPRERLAARIAIAWAVTWIGVFSFAGTKLPGYVWPAYPAVAVLLGVFWNDWRLGRIGRLDRIMPLGWASLAASGLAIVVGLALAARRIAPGTEWCGLLGIVPIAAAWIAWRQHAEGNRGWSLATLSASATLLVAMLVAGVADVVGSGRGPREIRPLISLEATRSPIVSFRKSPPSLVYYAAESRDGEAVAELWQPDAVADHFQRHPGGRLVTERAFLDDLRPSLPRGHGVIARFASLPAATEFVVVGPMTSSERPADTDQFAAHSAHHPREPSP